MAKTLANLNNVELAVIGEISEDFGITLEEALELALSDGTITEGAGGNYPYKPQGYSEIKYYVTNPKANLTKANKIYKKETKKDLFEDENFYMDINIPKDEDGNITAEGMSAVCLGAEVDNFVVLNVLYKGDRSKFDGTGKPLDTNFETCYAPNIFREGQDVMLNVKTGKSMTEIRAELERDYPSKDPKKKMASVPNELQTRFRVLVLGMVQVEGEWKKVYIEITKRYSNKEAIEMDFMQAVGKGQKLKERAKLKINGEDNNANPLLYLEPLGKVDTDTFKSYSQIALQELRDIAAWLDAQKAAISGAPSEAKSGSKPEPEPEEDSEDPFED